MVRKLLVVCVMLLLVPPVLAWFGGYEKVGPYGVDAAPAVAYYSAPIFLCTLLAAVLALLLGLVHPRIALWFGPARRSRVGLVYGAIAATSVAGFLESQLIAEAIAIRSATAMTALRGEITIGISVEAANRLARSRSRHIRIHPGLPGELMERFQVPLGDTSRYFVEYAYPGMWSLPRVVIETTAPPDHPEATVKAVTLVKDW